MTGEALHGFQKYCTETIWSWKRGRVLERGIGRLDVKMSSPEMVAETLQRAALKLEQSWPVAQNILLGQERASVVKYCCNCKGHTKNDSFGRIGLENYGKNSCDFLPFLFGNLPRFFFYRSGWNMDCMFSNCLQVSKNTRQSWFFLLYLTISGAPKEDSS